MRRLAAARTGAAGAEILTLPLMAARLAGGFTRPAIGGDIEHAVRVALESEEFGAIGAAGDLPGFVRAAGRSLIDLWEDGATLQDSAIATLQAKDVELLEARVRASLPAGVLSPIDLAQAALARLAHAPAVLGGVELDRVFFVAPVWRPLLAALRDVVKVTWRDPPAGVSWFAGAFDALELSPAAPDYVLCANPRAEAVEALRWLRALIAAGVAPREIGITAVSTEAWDDHFLALSRDAGLLLYFAHGLPALATEAGQACAALADILLRGLTQERFRRLVSYGRQSKLLAALSPDWRSGLAERALLTEPAHWRRALAEAVATGSADVTSLVMPAVDLLARGASAAEEAGLLLLPPAAQAVWASALRRAPVAAIEQALRDVRFPDGSDPGASAVWGGAQLLASAPRAHVRLLGLASQSWPRRGREDPLLPPHVFTRTKPSHTSPIERDRAAFAHLCARATGSCVISRSRRDARGGRQAVSPLVVHIPRDRWKRLQRDRRPEHAFNEADRLLARPDDRVAHPSIRIASDCLVNRRKSELTAHDGLIGPEHPLVLAALERPQSATSLKTMLRDPLAYVWRHVLAWTERRELTPGLALGPRAYGDLLHEVLRRVVDELGDGAGFARAMPDDIARAAAKVIGVIEQDWPLREATPPPLLWKHTLELAAAEARSALRQAVGEGTRSWAELSFGRAADTGREDLPWRPTAAVVLAKSNIKLTGTIDRLDRRADKDCRVTDYKTGANPPSDAFALRGGEELQRVIYTEAVRQLLPDTPHINAVLLYLCGELSATRAIADMDADAFVDAVAVAADVLRTGRTLAGKGAFEKYNDWALALPAITEGYKPRKWAAIERALADLSPIWDLE